MAESSMATQKRLQQKLAAQTKEVESIRQQLADCQAARDLAISEMAKWAREAGSAQVREAKLREALQYSLQAWNYDGVSDEHGSIAMEVDRLCNLPCDDTALKEAIKQAKKEALSDFADDMEDWDMWSRDICLVALREWSERE